MLEHSCGYKARVICKNVVQNFTTVNVQDYIAHSADVIFQLFVLVVEKYGINLFYF
jgi:hypothetical protein